MAWMTPSEAGAFLLRGEEYTILTHRRPDGDTVGCAAALCMGLRSLGKQAAVLENPQLTDRFAPYLRGLTAPELRGTVVSTDVSSVAQYPLNFNGSIALSIDHHGTNNGFAANTCLEADAGACAELVYKILTAMGVTITPEIATALYVGASTDTGCFRFANTTPQTLRIAADLVEAGADNVTINRTIFEIKSKARIGLEAYLASHMQLYCDGRVAICLLPQAEIDALGGNEDDADSLAGYCRNLEGVEIGGLIRDLPGNQSKVSLRSDSRLWDSSAICSLLGGGGHAAASGASLHCSMEELQQKVLWATEQVTGLPLTEAV